MDMACKLLYTCFKAIVNCFEERGIFMVSVGCRIHTHPARTDPGLVERFRNIPVANLDDCMGRTAALSSAIRPYGPRRLLGQAFTVRVPAGTI